MNDKTLIEEINLARFLPKSKISQKKVNQIYADIALEAIVRKKLYIGGSRLLVYKDITQGNMIDVIFGFEWIIAGRQLGNKSITAYLFKSKENITAGLKQSHSARFK